MAYELRSGGVYERRGLTMQEAVEALAYEFPEGKAYIQRHPSITNGPRWRWKHGRLWLQGGIGAPLVPPRPIVYPEACTSRDWIVVAECEPDIRCLEGAT